ncbi:MAG: hypothetical protein IPJ84_19015 [Bdellovibrionales bacterium]|nr:hypothetical protein [Bdellovibrionales bacterium]
MWGEKLVKCHFSQFPTTGPDAMVAPAELESATLCLEGCSRRKAPNPKNPNHSAETQAYQWFDHHFESPAKYNQKRRNREVSGEKLVNFSGVVLRLFGRSRAHHSSSSYQKNSTRTQQSFAPPGGR